MNFAHENNLSTKIRTNYHSIGSDLEVFFNDIYSDMRQKLETIDLENNSEAFVLFAQIVNEYLLNLDSFIDEFRISAQSKFRSTFLEELSVHLFRNLEGIQEHQFDVFNKGVFAGIKLDTNGNIIILKKDVDYCIGKKIDIHINNQRDESIIIPLIAVEVKTYLDATMFGEVQFSSREIKNASPNVRTYILMEYNQVSQEKLLKAKYENTINEIFSLRSSRTSSITARAIEQYYQEIKSYICTTDVDNIIIQDGRILHQ